MASAPDGSFLSSDQDTNTSWTNWNPHVFNLLQEIIITYE